MDKLEPTVTDPNPVRYRVVVQVSSPAQAANLMERLPAYLWEYADLEHIEIDHGWVPWRDDIGEDVFEAFNLRPPAIPDPDRFVEVDRHVHQEPS